MTDTPINPPTTHAERVKSFIGDLARPFAFYSVGGATAGAIVIAALRCQNGTEGALVIGAAGLIVGGMYGFKEWGNSKAGAQASEVEIAKTNAGTGT